MSRAVVAAGNAHPYLVIVDDMASPGALERILSAGVRRIAATDSVGPVRDAHMQVVPGKATWPGRKQVYRRYAADGSFAGGVVTLETDRQDGEPLCGAV
jgi:hypothetical protein